MIKPIEKPQGDIVVFFDGICGLCNRTVDFLIHADHEKRFRYCPLQSEYAKKILGQQRASSLYSFFLQEGPAVLERSTAVIRLGYHLGGGWRLLSTIGSFFPRPFRDLIYDTIAKYRYSWFGKKESCRIPLDEERHLFID